MDYEIKKYEMVLIHVPRKSSHAVNISVFLHQVLQGNWSFLLKVIVVHVLKLYIFNLEYELECIIHVHVLI